MTRGYIKHEIDFNFRKECGYVSLLITDVDTTTDIPY